MGRRGKNSDRTVQQSMTPENLSTKHPSTTGTTGTYANVSLKVLVFCAGGVLMGLEIAGSRVLAPHFGNSVFVWGSLISIFLIALSAGYYIGGRLADRHPSRILLNSICILVALWISAIPIFAYKICEWFVEVGYSEQSGPLVTSVVLFLLPSIGMGMVSPFSIRLSTESVSSVGTSSGTLYALSTMGSIAGTMLTTFVLIPLFGLSTILKGLGGILFLAGLITLPWQKNGRLAKSAMTVSLITLICFLYPQPTRLVLKDGEKNVLDVDTPYHHISVIDNEQNSTRQLRFDRYVESAIETKHPYRGLSPYTHHFHLAFLANPEIARTLFIGAGGAIGPRAFAMHDPQMTIDIVDIDPKVLEIARKHFFLEETPKIQTIAEDRRMFVRTAEEKYDCVILDAFTIGGRIPFHLVTKEFFELCRDQTTERGVFVMNINSAIEGPASRIFQSMFRTIQSVFPQTYAFAINHKQRGYTASANIILLATQEDKPLSFNNWLDRAKRHQSPSHVGPNYLQRAVHDLLVQLPSMTDAPIFTDDYAPIETMAF